MPVLSRFYGIIIRMYFIQADTPRRIFMPFMVKMSLRSPSVQASYLKGICRLKHCQWSGNGSNFTRKIFLPSGKLRNFVLLIHLNKEMLYVP